MKTVKFRGREDKLEIFAQLLDVYLEGDLLDVGCDQKYLAPFAKGRYIGVDIDGIPDIKVDLEHGLPFNDRSFDTVVAFDVLEHLENIHYVFDELCRVARKYIIVALPNMYEWHFRFQFMLGRRLSGKYGLSCEVTADHHKWLFSLNEARNFMKHNGAKNGFVVVDEVFAYYAYRRHLPRLITELGKLFKPYGVSLFAYSYWAVLKRGDNTV